MDETIFENAFTRDESTLRETFRYAFFKSPLMILYYILTAIYIPQGILFLIFNPYRGPLDVAIFAVVAFGYAVLIYKYRISVKTLIKRDKEMAHGEAFTVNLKVYDDKISIVTPASNQSVEFENIKYAFATQNYVTVVTKAGFMYIFKKNCFTKGYEEDFIAFLRGKNVKIRK